MRVYFASPFFNEEQIERERRLVNALRQMHFDVYAPSEHGILKPNAIEADRINTFDENIYQLDNADICFCVTDGKDIGSIWEAGYFYCQTIDTHKKLIYYCETLGDNPFNVMLALSASYVITSMDELANLPGIILNDVENKYAGKVQ